MMRFALIALALLPFLAVPAPAEDLIYKPSIDYTLDDGIMDEDEMQQEAQYVFRLCNENPFQRSYFNCECVAGAFLQRREKEGPMTDQWRIMDGIIEGRTAKCANTEEVAGSAYELCMAHMNTYRELEPGKEDYCSCVANKTANDFTKYPRLDSSYTEAVRYNAMRWCDDPQNRPRRAARSQ